MRMAADHCGFGDVDLVSVLVAPLDGDPVDVCDVVGRPVQQAELFELRVGHGDARVVGQALVALELWSWLSFGPCVDARELTSSNR